MTTTTGLRVPELDAQARAVLADPEHAWRREPRERKVAYARRHGVEEPAALAPAALDAALESVVGDPDFLASRWLAEGAKAALAVGRVRVPGELGTGFLVTPWLLLTNQHVVASPAVAAQSSVTFRYADRRGTADITGSVELDLDPGRCCVSSPVAELDFALVAVRPHPKGADAVAAPGRTFGWIPARPGQGKIVLGQAVNVVQHPGGRPQEVAFRENKLVSVNDADTITYTTDTQPGSSGSPVFNDDWDLVALHHQGAQEAVQPIGNVGIRISAVVAEIGRRAGAPAPDEGADAAALLAEFLTVGTTS